MKIWHGIGIAIFALLLVFSIGWGMLWIYGQRDTVPESVKVSAVSDGSLTLQGETAIAIGGLPLDEALKLVKQHSLAASKVRLTIQANDTGKDERSWTLDQLGFKAQVQGAVQALEGLRTGGIWTRAKYRYLFDRQLHVTLGWDAGLLDKAVRQQWGLLEANAPVNATRTIKSDDSIIYTPHSDAYRIDTKTLAAAAGKAIAQAQTPQWGAQGKPVVLDLPLMLVHPNMTLDKLKAQGVARKIAEFTTDFSTSGSGRAYNVTSTAKILNNWELAPGEIFDYRKVIAATREGYGFREAPVILNGELVPGIGGGICQVSSTLYNTVLLAGLDMTERRNHSLPVSYLPMGRDATFAEGYINFRFKNTTGKHLIIRTEASGGKLTVKLFGTMEKGVSYTLASKTIEEIAPTIKEVPSAAVQPGDRLLMTPGKPGYVVETYRTKLVDGKAVATKRISRDKYKAQAAVYAVAPENAGPHGSQGQHGKGKELLEDGVTD
ncbi:vancomycin resistance protein YoaR [Paenibacillus phyllosphaerae]|uniref:Vancomycin resistance protein YoaR n=1 Tax=Paenibacillus phyllosphaerae TaxID=274593 RepID=A0A7W5B4F7_9BACL|nr:VanW family protein [Paenibacillus phyllosphaerae]MBB3114229.1 vancomycin resistance protein YoaR [Paenibacillus phyllosphaerae]